MNYFQTEYGYGVNADCFDAFKHLEDNSVDMILCDLPYGTTACKWDAVLPFDKLWAEYKRVIKPNCAIVLTASQPFTTVLAASNVEWLRYEWIWVKNRPTNFAHAKNKPMKKHENVLVFSEGTTVHESQSKKRMPYYPQGLIDIAPKKVTKKTSELTDAFFQGRESHGEFVRDKTNYPHSILEFSTDQLGLHPTAKPVALMEYLIATYTNEGDFVLDNCAGSMTTGVAAENLKRKWLCFEKETEYYEAARERFVWW